MATKILSATYAQFNGILIDVEVHITKGLPSFSIVGLPDTSVKEAKERVRSAIINSGYEFPLGRITINLAPADVKKIGSLLDLPIAIGILMETNQIAKKDLQDFVIFGELSLCGDIKKVNGTIAIMLEGMNQNKKNFIFPYENIGECKYYNKANNYPFSNLKEVISFINYEDVLPFDMNEINLKEEKNFTDFSSIIGQDNSKRAMEIAAAGKHNLMVYGSTGVGKTMLARALPSILPDLSEEEELEIAKIYSISGLLDGNKKITRPFRAPHHTITISAMIGGGRIAKAGEVTLANKGVLFLDEVLEYKREVLEALREPLEEGEVHINRIQGSCILKADFILYMAMNMCPCGKSNLEDEYNSDCTCSEAEKRRYLNRLSKALMDRIDIFNYIPRIKYEELNKNNSEYTSKKMKERVLKAREKQKERLKGTKYFFNSQIRGKDIFELCRVSKRVNEILEYYFNNSHPSLRSYGKVITLARTIADLGEKKDIEESDVFEAIGYRKNFKGEII